MSANTRLTLTEVWPVMSAICCWVNGLIIRLVVRTCIRAAVSHSRCATRAVESRRPQLTSHS
jgi:hypothetical protein